jgi:hypothetical protein
MARLPFWEDQEAEPIRPHLYAPTYGAHELSPHPGEWIEYTLSLRAICKSFYFMWRMAEEYGPGDTIEYELRAGPLVGRRLVMYLDDMNLYEIPNPFGPPDACQEPIFRRHGRLLVADLRADWKSECVNAAKDFFGLFPSHNIGREEIRQWIDKLPGSRHGN